MLSVRPSRRALYAPESTSKGYTCSALLCSTHLVVAAHGASNVDAGGAELLAERLRGGERARRVLQDGVASVVEGSVEVEG